MLERDARNMVHNLRGPFDVPPFTYLAVGASVSYTLDYTGKLARSVEQRQALAQYQQSEADATYLTLTGSVALQAMMIASTRAQLQAVSELLAEDRDNVKLVRSAFQNGSVSKTDVLTAESQLASDETLLPPLYHQLRPRPPCACCARRPDAGGLVAPRFRVG
jgi:outer membrane protein TolC